MNISHCEGVAGRGGGGGRTTVNRNSSIVKQAGMLSLKPGRTEKQNKHTDIVFKYSEEREYDTGSILDSSA